MLKSHPFKIELITQLTHKTMLNKELLTKLNKEMTEEPNVKKLLMIINKEDLPEMKIDKLFLT